MRYYDLDTNGKVKGSYAVPQPEKTLVLLEDAPGDESKWDGSKWIPDQDKINVRLEKEEEVEIDKLVQAELKEQAIASLKVKGKLDANGKIKK
jgi:hypothetical protein